MPTFVLNDETKTNSYGFRIPNRGINLARFNDNPVMLNEHDNSTKGVIGKWANVRIEGHLLLADSDFDIAKPAAAEIAGQVERGYLKGASMGVSFERANMKLATDHVAELSPCEKYESSICAIPSNSGSTVRLYVASTGELMSDEEVKLTLSTLKNQNPEIIIPQNKMKKLILTPAILLAVGLTSDNIESTEDILTISNAIQKLHNDNSGLLASNAEKETKIKELNAKLTEQNKTTAKALVAAAVIEGKITADLSVQFEEMAMANPELAAKVIAGMPAKVSLAATIIAPSGVDGDFKTAEDFQKAPLAKQLAFKAANPEAYQKLFA